MRDFFERQDVARRLSGRLAAILLGSLLGTVVATAVVFAGLITLLAMIHVTVTTNLEIGADYWSRAFVNRFAVALVVTGIIVFGTAILRTLRNLEAGGTELAKQLGGQRVMAPAHDACNQQLLNIVDELAIASGTAAPKVFVLHDETSINAFAAGIDPKDTVVGVTRGALECLDRSQLQGVLAHEFSHIVNRDVSINMLTLGALQGVETVASAARKLLDMGVNSGVQGSMLATTFGTVLWPVGQIGVLFSALAKMALNRQREYLADASAVQFTRNPEGLSSALQLIAGQQTHGGLRSSAAQAASHLFFTEGTLPLSDLLSSHPPLTARIRRLDPEWDGVIPTALPDHVASLIQQPEVCAPEPEITTDSAGPCIESRDEMGQTVALHGQSPNAKTVLSDDSVSADNAPATTEDIVSDADKQALLETLAAVRANRVDRKYDAQITHWPTLAATAAAVICLSYAFSWLTTR